MVFVQRGRDINGRRLALEDPMADELHRAAAGPDGALVDRLLDVRTIFAEDLAEDPRFREAVTEHVARLLTEIP
jgi:mannitol-1-phosphate/altronate dehydrogenase